MQSVHPSLAMNNPINRTSGRFHVMPTSHQSSSSSFKFFRWQLGSMTSCCSKKWARTSPFFIPPPPRRIKDWTRETAEIEPKWQPTAGDTTSSQVFLLYPSGSREPWERDCKRYCSYYLLLLTKNTESRHSRLRETLSSSVRVNVK